MESAVVGVNDGVGLGFHHNARDHFGNLGHLSCHLAFVSSVALRHRLPLHSIPFLLYNPVQHHCEGEQGFVEAAKALSFGIPEVLPISEHQSHVL
ncbi:MAG: hypothetical protein ACRENX_09020 [Candidatus Dormibacteria bacterium]